MGVATLGVELEGGWICTCPVRNHSNFGIEIDETTGVVRIDGGIESQGFPVTGDLDWNPEWALQLDRALLPAVAHLTRPKPCCCIPAGMKADSTVKTGVTKQGELIPPAPLTPLNYAEWVAANYPHVVNMSCGLHVHFAFDNHQNTYQQIARPEIEDFLIKGLVRWGQAMKIPLFHPFWRRLAGGNYYCRRGLTQELIDRQMSDDASGSRYQAINFCLVKHGTLEIRVLPMFKEARAASKAIGALIRLMNQWIDVAAQMPPRPNDFYSDAVTIADMVDGGDLGEAIIDINNDDDSWYLDPELTIEHGTGETIREAQSWRYHASSRRRSCIQQLVPSQEDTALYRESDE